MHIYNHDFHQIGLKYEEIKVVSKTVNEILNFIKRFKNNFNFFQRFGKKLRFSYY